ncbi:hypothetical protein ACFQL1_16860 [Halomicroarcula sp. GCM10025709]|uniref:DUF7521 family protein n=1 Tax=Haloarcula TaxID=2237 RepID=UPI0024C39B93|nr:hypothetical protein [Halomicroarcula sp. YJ-61-S]
MIGPSTILLIAAKTVTLLCGAVLTALTYRAYRRTDARAMRALFVGIGLVTVGSIFAGSLHQVFEFPVATSVTVESSFTAAGFAVLTYSLYTEQPTDG